MHPRLARGGLYAITDGPRIDLLTAVEAALRGGAAVVQYRDKSQDAPRRLVEAIALRELCASFKAALIINDDVGLAARVNAAGVHLGENDSDIDATRKQLGTAAIIGVSCYDSLDRARQLAAAGADYLAFGAFYASPTKPHARTAPLALLREARYLGLPLVAIGGITADNAQPVIDAGADFVAAISGVFAAADVRGAASRYANLFTKQKVDFQ